MARCEAAMLSFVAVRAYNSGCVFNQYHEEP